jgi:L-threonylcarbamoyladenylate synthase
MADPRKTLLFKVDPERPDREKITCCAAILRGGALVAFPTETVYGLAANLLDPGAIDSLYKVKGRPRAKPFTVHIADTSAIKKMGCRLDKRAKALIRDFWPGPLTVILKAKGGRKVGFRMPANKTALELIRHAAVPVVAPSANLSGRKPPTKAADVLKQLGGKIDALIDAGRTKVGVESTVVDLTASPPRILREGAVRAKEILRYYE